MKITWFLTLSFCVFLNLVTGMNLGPPIRIGQCRSMCLQNYTTNGMCRQGPRYTNADFGKCWYSCSVVEHFKENRSRECERCYYQSCQTACTFYETHVIEENEYKPTKLPAPEEGETIHLNNNDIALMMRKNTQGVWTNEKFYCEKKQLTMKPGYWIIIINWNGAIKHYSSDKWQPEVQSLNSPQDGDPLYQAYITWKNWQTQLKEQRNKEQFNTSFVVTWQQETGDGIMGNQVADNESAQISLPPGRYLVRVATDDGPGSYPIVIDTGLNATSTVERSHSSSIFYWLVLFYLLAIAMFIYGNLMAKIIKKRNTKKIKENESEKKMEEGSLTKMPSSCSSFSSCSYISISDNVYDQMLQMMGMDINANVETRDADANTQGTNANAQNANVI